MMVVGHAVRIAAFITAGSNFSHIVETGARPRAYAWAARLTANTAVLQSAGPSIS